MTTETAVFTLPIVSLDVSGQPSGGSLLAFLLEEQQQLTAVERFAIDHALDSTPLQARYYESLLPATAPGLGQQYAFEVDLDRCSGCKACVTACHTLNGLDDSETWRDVGLLIGGTASNPLMQHVTTACHHCLEPACMQGCPVNAYEKDPITGIVRHLDDQCIGCQYCTLACPYDVPKYHAGKGIVRKCDMCSHRLAVGEAPACVQACPHQAIAIRIVDVQQILDDAETSQFLPAAPDPQLTHPTTRYKSARSFPRNTLPADYHQTAPQHPHWPLIVTLVLTQLSVGAFTAAQIAISRYGSDALTALLPWHAATSLALGLLALAASLFHLGRPLYAYRAFIGLRHSWLSREIVAFGFFAKLAMAYAAVLCFKEKLPPFLVDLTPILGWGVVGSGLVGVFCSVMIYVVTQREFWSFDRTLMKFGLTTALLGTATLAAVVAAVGGAVPESQQLFILLIRSVFVVGVVKLCVEMALFRHLWSPHLTTLGRSARLHIGPLRSVTLMRYLLGFLGSVLLPIYVLQGSPNRLWCGVGMLVLLVAGEFMERYLYFAGVAAPRMPGPMRT
ncbi:MAG: DmsC/YnfH family molybdoenzyme membrane anchor subunit [Planctomycetaceae bacterium]